MKYLIYLLLIMSLSGCSSKSDNPVTESGNASFINLKELVNADIQQLASRNCNATKKGVVNGDTAISVVSDVQWKKELQAIADADINKKSWIPHFRSNTLNLQGDTVQMTIQTTKEDIPVRLINVCMLDEKILKVYIEKQSSNLFFSSEQKITYQPGRSYHISGSQKALFLSRKEFEITSVFNCKE